MPEKKTAARPSARKAKDKWRAKGWYTIVAPEYFNKAPLGETPADEPAKLQTRIIEVTVQDLNGDMTKMHVQLFFQVHEVRGTEVTTRFVGHDMAADYIRRLTRRQRTRTEGVFDVVTKDGVQIRVKPMLLVDHRIQASRENLLREIMEKTVREAAAGKDLGSFVKLMALGDLARAIGNACKPIQPLFRAEVRKSEVLAYPETAPAAETPAEVEPLPPEAPAPEAAVPPA